MARFSVLMLAALPTALLLSADRADAARPVLAEFLARAPAEPGQPAMSALALEACLRKAGELDGTGVAIDSAISAIERETAEAMFLQHEIADEMPRLGGYNEEALDAFQQRIRRHEELAKKFQAEFPVYRARQEAYDAAVAEFDRDCARGFTASDLAAVKAKLGIK